MLPSLLVVLFLVIGSLMTVMVLTMAMGAAFLAMRGEERAALAQLEAMGFQRDGRLVTGQLAGHAVEARRSPEGTWSVTMEGLPRDLALRTSQRGTRSHRTGDRTIDDRWAIGSVEGGIGRLSRQARIVLARIRPAVDGCVLSEGRLLVTVHATAGIGDVLANLERLAIELSGDARHHLVENVRGDPDPRVRGHMLWELAQQDRQAAIAAVEHRDPHASWGAEELVLMGELLGRVSFLERALEHPDTTRRLATRAMAAWLALDEDLQPGLRIVYRRFGARGLAEVADLVRGRHAHHAAVWLAWLDATAALPDGKDVQRALVAMVRSLQDAAVEEAAEPLSQLVDRLRGPAQVRAIQAVGAMGSTTHVGVLRRLQQGMAVTDFPARKAVDEAVAQIQGRASGQAGALSLAVAGEGVGMLAVAEGPDDLALAVAPQPVSERKG